MGCIAQEILNHIKNQGTISSFNELISTTEMSNKSDEIYLYILPSVESVSNFEEPVSRFTNFLSSNSETFLQLYTLCFDSRVKRNNTENLQQSKVTFEHMQLNRNNFFRHVSMIV